MFPRPAKAPALAANGLLRPFKEDKILFACKCGFGQAPKFAFNYDAN